MISKVVVQSVIDRAEKFKEYKTVNSLMREVSKARFAHGMSPKDCLNLVTNLGCVSKYFTFQPAQKEIVQKAEEIEDIDINIQEKIQALIALHPVVVKLCKRFGYVTTGANDKEILQYRKFRINYFRRLNQQPDPKTQKVDKPYPICDSDKAKLEMIQSLEQPIVDFNSPLCISLAKKYFVGTKHKMPAVTLEDFIQEAKMAVVNSIYGYDGRTKFVTYIHTAIENALKDFQRMENPLSPPNAQMVKDIASIHHFMTTTGTNFVDAARQLGFSDKQILEYENVDVTVHREIYEDFKLGDLLVDHRTTNPNFDPLMLDALKQCDFSPLEKEAFSCFLQNEKNFQERLASKFKITRSGVSAALQRAKAKVRTMYFSLAPSEAA